MGDASRAGGVKSQKVTARARRAARRAASRQEAQNERRGKRARDHLAQQRRRAAAKQRNEARRRDRSGLRSGDAAWPVSLPRIVAFACSLLAGVLLAGPLQSGLGSLTRGGLGRIETLSIQGNARLDEQAIAAATGVEPGSPLAEISTREVASRLEALPWIEAASVLRLPPSTLLVRVHERRPAAVLTSGDRHWLVDPNGIAFVPIPTDEIAKARDDDTAADPRAPSSLDITSLPRLRSATPPALDEPHEMLRMGVRLGQRLLSPAFERARAGGELWLELPVADAPEGWILRGDRPGLEVILGRRDLMARLDRFARLVRADLTNTSDGRRQEASLHIDLRFADRAVLRATSAPG